MKLTKEQIDAIKRCYNEYITDQILEGSRQLLERLKQQKPTA